MDLIAIFHLEQIQYNKIDSMQSYKQRRFFALIASNRWLSTGCHEK